MRPTEDESTLIDLRYAPYGLGIVGMVFIGVALILFQFVIKQGEVNPVWFGLVVLAYTAFMAMHLIDSIDLKPDSIVVKKKFRGHSFGGLAQVRMIRIRYGSFMILRFIDVGGKKISGYYVHYRPAHDEFMERFKAYLEGRGIAYKERTI